MLNLRKAKHLSFSSSFTHYREGWEKTYQVALVPHQHLDDLLRAGVVGELLQPRPNVRKRLPPRDVVHCGRVANFEGWIECLDLALTFYSKIENLSRRIRAEPENTWKMHQFPAKTGGSTSGANENSHVMELVPMSKKTDPRQESICKRGLGNDALD